MLSVEENDDINYVSMNKYAKTTLPFEITDNKIAVIYAVGQIETGNGNDLDKIYPDRLTKYINEAAKDSTIKAIVLRVNSPGGSALSSEIIWRELMLAKKNKPLIISMGDLAASGGYYISSAGDYIVANPTTITGSIGVFGLLWNAKDFLNNKIGINVHGYKTNKYADLGSLYRPITKFEKEKMQNLVEKTYRTFLTRVANGRNMTTAEVDSIGQGRVWSGLNAKEIGLVDKFGGLNDAIKIAAKRARIKKYKVVEYPKKKEFMEQLMDALKEDFEQTYIKSLVPGEWKEQAGLLEYIKNHKGVMAIMPYIITFN
jgi:protease-4